jgi:two-component system, OmpR family, clock-associated histidine kinase SasA
MRQIIHKSKIAWEFVINRPSWRAKLIILFVAVLTISMLVQLLYILPWLENREIKNTQDKQSSITGNIARELDRDLNETKEFLIGMATWPEFRSMEIEAQQQLIDKFTSTTTEVLPNIIALSIINPEGFFVASSVVSVVGLPSRYTDSLYIAVRDGVLFGPPRFSPDTSYLSTHVIVPIKSNSEYVVGFLMGHLNLTDMTNSIRDSIRDYPLEVGSEAFLIDQVGTVIAQSGIDIFALEGGPLSLNYSDRPMVETALQNDNEGYASGSREYIYKGIGYFGTYTLLSSNRWIVLVNTPMQTVTSGSSFMRNTLILINIAIFIITLLVTLFFTNQITLYRKRTENELTKYKDHLEELVSSRTRELTITNQKLENEVTRRVEFTRIIVHELKSPLTSLQVANDLLVEEAKENPYRDIGSSINHSVNSLDRTINELLDIARGEIGLLKLNYRKVNLEDFFNKLNDELTLIAVKKGILFEFNIQPGIPEVTFDNERISQIIYNLVDNAFKFTPRGEIVRVSAKVKDGQLFVSVSDKGCGISKDRQSTIFDHNKISSLQNRSDIQRLSGLGIGLFLSKMIVDLHKGRIWVESELGQGSNFIFSIPTQLTENL